MQALGESGTDRAAMSSLDPRDEGIIGHAARHLAGQRFTHPGSAPAAAARLIDELRQRNLLKAERALCHGEHLGVAFGS